MASKETLFVQKLKNLPAVRRGIPWEDTPWGRLNTFSLVKFPGAEYVLSRDARYILDGLEAAGKRAIVMGRNSIIIPAIDRYDEAENGKKVILKLARPDLLYARSISRGERIKILNRLYREAAILAKVYHPNIAGMKNLVGIPFGGIIVPGFAQIRLDALPEEIQPHQIPEIALPIASALDYLHQMNITHKDVQKANIGLASDGTPMLFDFDIAHTDMEGLPGANSTENYVPYADLDSRLNSPLTGDIPIERQDVYSLACMVFEMLEKNPPFGSSGKIIPEQELPMLKNPQLNASNKNLLQDVFASGLANERNNRPASCLEFAQAVAACLR